MGIVDYKYEYGKVYWQDEDIEQELESYGIDPTPDNIERVWGSMSESTMTEVMCEAGFDYIDRVICDEFREEIR